MAVKKTASPSKAKAASAPKKAAKAKAAPKTEAAAPKTTTPAPKAKAAPKKAASKPPETKTAAPKAAAPKAKSAPKAKAAPVKITATQAEFLAKIGSSGESGYLTAKKAEVKTIEALLGKKLVKKGAKDKASGGTHYLISTAGKKHLESTPPATPASGS